MEVNGPGLLTDHRVLFQSGMLTFQITSPSTQWAPRRRTRTLTIGQKVRKNNKRRRQTKQRCSCTVKDACCNTRTRVCVELQVEIDLVVTVAWQSRTS